MEGVWGHSPIRADIVDVLFLLIFVNTIYLNGAYILRNFINTKDNFFVISIGIGMMFVSILVSIFLFFQILTKNNILLLFLLLQFPLVSIIIKNQLSHYRPIFLKK